MDGIADSLRFLSSHARLSQVHSGTREDFELATTRCVISCTEHLGVRFWRRKMGEQGLSRMEALMVLTMFQRSSARCCTTAWTQRCEVRMTRTRLQYCSKGLLAMMSANQCIQTDLWMVQVILQIIDHKIRDFNHACLSTAMLKLGKLRKLGKDYSYVWEHKAFFKLLQTICTSLGL